MGEARVARIALGARLSRVSGFRPLLLHELTHPGISTPSPDSALVRCFRHNALSPRPPAWRDASAAFAVRLQLGSPLPHPLSPRGILRQALAGRRGVSPPHLEMWRFGACGCRGREEPRPQRPGAWIPRIPPPDKKAETVARRRGRVLLSGGGGGPLPSDQWPLQPPLLLFGAGLSLGVSTFWGH